MSLAHLGLGDEYAWWCPSIDNEGAGTSTLTDLSGNGRDVTLYNTNNSNWAIDEGQGGSRALSLNGSNQYGETAVVEAFGSTERSISCWFKTSSSNREAFIHMGSVTGASTGSRLEIRLDSNPVNEYVVRCEFSNSYIVSSTQVNDGQWHNVIVTFQGTNAADFKIYVDGVQETIEKSLYQDINTTEGPIFIGNSIVDFRELSGSLDDIRIFRRLLTPEEIDKLSSCRAKLSPTGIGDEIGWWCPSIDHFRSNTNHVSDLALTNHGVRMGESHYADVDGKKAIYTDGTTGYTDCGNGVPINNQVISYSIWVKTTGVIPSIARFANWGHTTGLLIYNGYPAIQTSGDNSQASGSHLHQNDTWTHYVFIYKDVPGEYIIYANGVQCRQYPTNDDMSSASNFEIGRGDPTTPILMHWDDARVFDRELTAQEVWLLSQSRGFIRELENLWEPSSNNSLTQWLDSSDESTYTLDGLAINEWRDKSGLNNNMSQTGALRPTYVETTPHDSLPGVNFDFTSTLVGSISNGGNLSAATAMAVVTLKPGFSNGEVLHIYSGASQGYRIRTISTALNLIFFDASNSSAVFFNDGTPLFEQTYMLGMAADSGHQSIHRDGQVTASQSVTNISDGPIDSVMIGDDSTGSKRLNAYVHEILIFNEIIPQQDIELVEGYLAHKWNLEDKLPASHPYKHFPPTMSGSKRSLINAGLLVGRIQ